MVVYIFTQMKECVQIGLDYAWPYKVVAEQGVQTVKYVCTDTPNSKVIEIYKKAGIDKGQMINMYQHFTSGHDAALSVKVEDKLKELEESLHYTSVEYQNCAIQLIKGGYVIATILLNEKDRDYVFSILYFSFAKLIRSESYLEDGVYVEHFKTAKSETGVYAKLTRRSFYNGDGSVAFDQIFEEGKEWYLFPDGRQYTKPQLMVEFVKRLDLSKEDVVLLDDSVSDELTEAVFTFGKAARIVVLAHAGHHFEIEKTKNKDVGILERSILKEYPYKWFRYAEAIDTMVVSTNSQKEFLKAELEACRCRISNIRTASIEGEFTYAVLHESYGGNMALSWTFHGKPDGFLIYDESGHQLYETRNEHQHYYLIKRCEREHGFVVKAFVDTACGRAVTAESEVAYLSTRQYEKPLVSLVIPVYNAEDYIARTLDNALAQSLIDLEIIAVDDGCTDSSPEILEWYAKKSPNVVVIHKENGGVAEARNTGIEAAQGEYIGFMDNDDMIRPEMMEKAYGSAKKNDCDIVIYSAYEITNDGYKVIIQYAIEEDRRIDVENFFHNYIWGSGMYVVIWNKLYRSSLVKGRLIPNIRADDDAWTPYILSYADTVSYLNDYLYEWDRVIRESTQVDEWNKQLKEERFEMYKKTILFYLQKGNPKRVELLKELAKKKLIEMENSYAYDAYEKFREWIDEKF